MARYRMDDRTVVDTDKASKKYEDASDWDGSNNISRATGSQWVDQRLYRSRKGRYYLVTHPRIDGQNDHAEWVSNQEAARWLTLNGHEIPDELKEAAEQVTE